MNKHGYSYQFFMKAHFWTLYLLMVCNNARACGPRFHLDKRDDGPMGAWTLDPSYRLFERRWYRLPNEEASQPLATSDEPRRRLEPSRIRGPALSFNEGGKRWSAFSFLPTDRISASERSR
jgi:hypothetical protein